MRLGRRAGLTLLAAAVAAGPLSPVSAATSWWTRAPGPQRALQAIASNSDATTLVITAGRAYWLDAHSGKLVGCGSPQGVQFVAAAGSQGLALNSDGALYRLRLPGLAHLLQRLPGEPRGLAISSGSQPVALAATTAGLYLGRLRSGLRRVAGSVPGNPVTAVAPPVSPGQPFALATRLGIELVSVSGRIRSSRGAPHLGDRPVLAEMGDGILLAGDQAGMIYAHYRTGWNPVFQLLPYGGVAGVPRLTAILGVGPDAAYVATSGFGTLLTPDAGFTWYRAAPATPDGRVVALAALGPLYATHPSGLVAAAAPSGLFLHRLQTLPGPPVYAGASQTAEVVGTAAVTVGASVAVILAMWWWERRRRGRQLSV